jgi:hypothetical protein
VVADPSPTLPRTRGPRLGRGYGFARYSRPTWTPKWPRNALPVGLPASYVGQSLASPICTIRLADTSLMSVVENSERNSCPMFTGLLASPPPFRGTKGPSTRFGTLEPTAALVKDDASVHHGRKSHCDRLPPLHGSEVL